MPFKNQILFAFFLTLILSTCNQQKSIPCKESVTPKYDGSLVTILDEKTGLALKDTLMDLKEKKRDIYKACRTYTFDGNISIYGKKIFYTKVDMFVPGKRFAPDSFKQDEVVYRYYDFKFYSSNHSYISPKILDQLHYQSHTGIIENVETVWTHPFREGPFYKLENCPFPEIRLPIESNKHWTNSLSIENGYEELSNTFNNCTYAIVDTSSINLAFDKNIKTWKLVSECENSKKSKCTHTFYFNKDYGFVKQHYTINDSIAITFEITRFEN